MKFLMWNNNKSGNYGNKQWSKDNKSCNKQDKGKSFEGGDKKPWQKDQKQWNNKDSKPWQQSKESKPKEACITLTKDVKYFCPRGYDNGIFQAVATILHDKVEQAKKAGPENAKMVNVVECESFIKFFNIPEQMYDVVMAQITGEATPKISGNSSD